MLPTPPGWRSRRRGEAIDLAAPSGAMTYRYRERVRPLRSAAAIARDWLARQASFRWDGTLSIERLTTAEGEHGALVGVDGLLAEQPARRVVGMVFGDDFYALLNGLCVASSEADAFTELTRTLLHADRHELGVRRRRFVYRAPTGWQGRARGLVTEWTPPRFPAEACMLEVFPAVPSASFDPQVLLDGLGADAELREDLSGAIAIPLPGEWRQLTGIDREGWFARRVAVLDDGRYAYPVRLDTRSSTVVDHGVELLRTLVGSIEPVPAPREIAKLHGAATSLAFWSE